MGTLLQRGFRLGPRAQAWDSDTNVPIKSGPGRRGAEGEGVKSDRVAGWSRRRIVAPERQQIPPPSPPWSCGLALCECRVFLGPRYEYRAKGTCGVRSYYQSSQRGGTRVQIHRVSALGLGLALSTLDCAFSTSTGYRS